MPLLAPVTIAVLPSSCTSAPRSPLYQAPRRPEPGIPQESTAALSVQAMLQRSQRRAGRRRGRLAARLFAVMLVGTCGSEAMQQYRREKWRTGTELMLRGYERE